MKSISGRMAMIGSLICLGAESLIAQAPDTLYPNLCPRTCNLEVHANQYVHPDTVWFWYENGPANIGKGELRILSGDTLGTNPQTAKAIQRISLDNGDSIYDTIGTLVFDDALSHDHWHFEDFVQYRLLTVVNDTAVGDSVIVSPKSGFCLVDFHDSIACGCDGLEGSKAPDRVFTTTGCLVEPPGLFMGISVGWYDLYGFGIEGQAMNIAGVANGVYWLESTVNANGNVRETSTANNVAMIKVNIISTKDSYEANNSGSSPFRVGK